MLVILVAYSTFIVYLYYMETDFLNNNTKIKIAFLCLLLMSSFDIWFDFSHGIPIKYLIFEGFVFFVCLIGFNFYLTRDRANKKEQIETLKKLKHSVNEKETQLKKLNKKVLSYREAFSNEIINCFNNWGLTKSESQVAGLLLKGLSLKEIADLRSASENTVRSQCTSIYKKSKLTNRSQLSSYFLDDLI